MLNELNGPNMSREMISAYFERIGVDPLRIPQEPDLDFLALLQWSHMNRVPYENLDILSGNNVSLDREKLFSKVVRNNRGGVCSETNTLYNWLLDSLGFDVTSYTSRIISNTAPVQMQGHRIIKVNLNGSDYITDVGFNYEHHHSPLLLEENTVQPDGLCNYKLTKDPIWGWIMWQERPGKGWRKKLSFTREAHIDIDFIPGTFYASSHPDSIFNKTIKVSKYINGIFFAIRSGNYLTETGGVEEILEPSISRQRANELLQDVFDLKLAI